MFAEALAIHFDETAAVDGFLGLHGAEDLGSGGVIFFEGGGEVGIGAAVLFFEGDRQGENFLLRKEFERFGHEKPFD